MSFNKQCRGLTNNIAKTIPRHQPFNFLTLVWHVLTDPFETNHRHHPSKLFLGDTQWINSQGRIPMINTEWRQCPMSRNSFNDRHRGPISMRTIQTFVMLLFFFHWTSSSTLVIEARPRLWSLKLVLDFGHWNLSSNWHWNPTSHWHWNLTSSFVMKRTRER